MKDQYKRTIDYMRISVTDRCNLRCRYCMPEEGIECTSHEDILTFEEILQIAEAGAEIGIKKIKITGGEPLVRKGVISLVGSLKKVPGIEEVTMTTNGVLLKEMAEGLYLAGLDAVNISLDTLLPSKYVSITRRDMLEAVIAGIEKAYQLGLRIKINCVAMKNFNENEIPMLAGIARNNNIDVRFIELMPIGLGRNYEYISVKEVQDILEAEYGAGQESKLRHGNGPAVYLDYEGFQGSIGFISAMTQEFCDSCNRVRLTAQGELKLCLNHNQGICLRSLLRENHPGEISNENKGEENWGKDQHKKDQHKRDQHKKGQHKNEQYKKEQYKKEQYEKDKYEKDKYKKDRLRDTMEDFIFKKPYQHCFHEIGRRDTEHRKMVQIGG